MNRRQFVSVGSQALGLLWTGVRRGDVPSDWEPFDVRTFGARGDGRSDDSLAFLGALRAAGVGGGTVIVPAGHYVLHQPLRVASGVRMAGSGSTSILDWQSDTRYAVVLSGITDAGLSSLTIRGSLSWGVLVEHAKRVLVERCDVSGATILNAGYSGGVIIAASSSVRVANGVFAGNGAPDSFKGSDIQCNGFGTGLCSGIEIIENTCSSRNVAFNICCFDSDHVRVERNRVSGARTGPGNNTGYGIVLYGTAANPQSNHDNVVLGNDVRDTEGTGIYLVRGIQSLVEANTLRRVALKQLDGTLPVGGIVVNDPTVVSIVGNTIDDTPKAGIAVSVDVPMIASVRVEKNKISRADRAGIHLRGGVSKIEIRENELRDTRGGIVADSPLGQSDVIIADNDLRLTRGATAGITLSAAKRSRIERNAIDESGSFGIDAGDPDGDLALVDNHVTKQGARATGPVEAVRVRRP
ncbi:MAG: right-handed parallel beta-helix repeat-containing protein [bacterium]